MMAKETKRILLVTHHNPTLPRGAPREDFKYWG
jgi:hypothetical protein